jgi:hypothetical protein
MPFVVPSIEEYKPVDRADALSRYALLSMEDSMQ